MKVIRIVSDNPGNMEILPVEFESPGDNIKLVDADQKTRRRNSAVSNEAFRMVCDLLELNEDEAEALDPDVIGDKVQQVYVSLAEESIRSQGYEPGLITDEVRQKSSRVITQAEAQRMLITHAHAVDQIDLLSDEDVSTIASKYGRENFFRKNRPISTKQIERLSADMVYRLATRKTGWRHMPDQPICISRGYELPNGRRVGQGMITQGQHRLLALADIAHGAAAFDVVAAADPVDYRYLDTGLPRNESQVMGAQGVAHPRLASSVALSIGMMKSPRALSTHRSRKMDSLSVREELVEAGIPFDELVDMANGLNWPARNHRTIARAMAATSIMATLVWPQAPTKEFFTAWTVGDVSTTNLLRAACLKQGVALSDNALGNLPFTKNKLLSYGQNRTILKLDPHVLATSMTMYLWTTTMRDVRIVESGSRGMTNIRTLVHATNTASSNAYYPFHPEERKTGTWEPMTKIHERYPNLVATFRERAGL